MSLVQTARINDLPLELLSLIFVTLVDAGLHARSISDGSYGSIDYPTLLSSVCAYWRRVATSIPHIWSYIDLSRANGLLRNLERAKLWLERSQDSPIRIRIGKGGEGSENRSLMGPFRQPSNVDEPLAAILRSSAPSIYSFTLKYADINFATEALSILLSGNAQQSIRKLALRQSRSPVITRRDLLPQNELDQLLEPLHVLHLERSFLELEKISCRNLVELQLKSPLLIPWAPQLIYLLEANPSLHTLVLDNADTIGVPPSHIQSIRMPALRNLQLSVSLVFMEWFLKLLVPGTNELDLHLSFLDSSGTGLSNTMTAFFQRTRIKSLFLVGEWDVLPTLFPLLAYLQNLGLCAYDVAPDTLGETALAEGILPNLHTVNLVECLVMDDAVLSPGLCTLLSLPSVRRIRHWHCGYHFKYGGEDKFQEVLESEFLAAMVRQTPEADFRFLPSPFC